MTAPAILIPVPACIKCGAENRYLNGSCKPCMDLKPCIKCGKFERSSQGACKACKKAYNTKNAVHLLVVNKAWRDTRNAQINAKAREKYAANPEKAKAAISKWVKANPEKAKAMRAIYKKTAANKRTANGQPSYYEINTLKIAAYSKAYRKEKPESSRAASALYAARIKAAGPFSVGLKDRLFASQKGLCACCNQPLGDDFQKDHIMPLSLGGRNNDENLQLLRRQCNSQKRASHPDDYMRSKSINFDALA